MIGSRLLVALLLPLLAAACRESGSDAQDSGQKAQAAASASDPRAGRCREHGVPKPLCTKCNPALIPVFKARGDWCGKHGFPKSFCPVCDPNAQFPVVKEPTAADVDWCAGHGVPESKCTKCNSSLIPKFRAAGDWCAEHGFPESVCPVCKPRPAPKRAAIAAVDWCLEHGLPESKCTNCNPGLAARFRAAGDWCAGHGFPESVCPVCNPQKPPVGAERAAIEARIVRFRSPDIEKAAGIRTITAQRSRAAPSVGCTARIEFDGDRVAEIRAIVPGIVRRVRVALGASVKRGAALFVLESTLVGKTQGALQTARERVRTARANLARQRDLLGSGIASAREVELAKQELIAAQATARAARATLRMAGAAQAAPSGRLTLTAPMAGTVVRRPAVVGALASEITSLATIVDTSVMWALCDVPEAEASRIAVGQRATVNVEGGGKSGFEGKITWISAEVNPRTRTVTARAAVPNPDGKLRANQFARARIETSSPRTAVSVPRAAVQRVGEREVVFVRTAQGVYSPRVVRRTGGGEAVQVEGSVLHGDAVVTTGAILLRTEITPGSIGAGCCEVDPPGGG